MRILILTNNDLYTFNFRRELIHKLIDNGHIVYLVFPKEKYNYLFDDFKLKIINVNLDRRGMSIFKDSITIYKYSVIIKKIKPDLILSYTIKPNIYSGLISKKTRLISNVTGLGDASSKKGLQKKLIHTLYKNALKNMDWIFFQNIKDMDYFACNFNRRSNVSLLPGSGVNISKYNFHKRDFKNKIKVYFISRIMKSKGIETYLDLANRMQKEEKFTFNVLGYCEENYTKELMRYDREKIIIYHGFQKEVYQYYQDADVIVFPSIYPEGISNVLLEGAATGCAIITSNLPGCKEVVEDKKNGYLIDPYDINSIISALNDYYDLSEMDKKSMSNASRQLIIGKFNREIVTSEYLKIINGFGGDVK